MTGFTSAPGETPSIERTRSTPAPQLPASTLAHLWPGLVLGRPEDWPGLVFGPAGSPDADSDSADISRSRAVMAAALVPLRDYGLVQFAIERKKVLFVKSVEVTLAVTGQAVLGGIEADLSPRPVMRRPSGAPSAAGSASSTTIPRDT
jgi:hypothetical protein